MSVSPIQSGKSALRRLASSRRRALTQEQVDAQSAAIADRVWAMPEVQGAGSVLSYVSARDNEVDTHGLITRFLAAEKAVWVPVAGAEGEMRWSRLSALSELIPGKYGILEPATMYQRFLAVPRESVCLVPGLLFTPEGHRLGYGKGFFDRFLAAYTGFSIGLAYDMQIEPALPLEPHDLPVKRVVTPSRVYTPKR